MHMFTRLFAIAATVALASPALAGLDGASVSGKYVVLNPNPVFPPTDLPNFTVGAGPEAVFGIGSLTFDFNDTGLDVTLPCGFCISLGFDPFVFHGFVFTSPAFSGLQVSSLNTSVVGFGADRATIVGNELRLNFESITFLKDDTFALGFTTPGIPEPATWAMMIAGFGIVGAAARRRTTATIHA